MTIKNNKHSEKIFDHAFKKMLTLSSKAVTNMINGLFDTDYDPDATTINYHWTEHQADNTLKTTLADTILVLNNKDAYHMEAQIEEDYEIVFRAFSYGCGYADVNKEIIADKPGESPVYILHFPNPRVIYLGDVSSNVPDQYNLKLDFKNGTPYTYTVPTVKLANISAQELNDRKMVILIPFHLLKLRKLMAKNRTQSTISSLKKLVKTDILGSIDTNLQLGNITPGDAHQLVSLTKKLYAYLYDTYTETEEVWDMIDQSLELESDELILRLEAAEEAMKSIDKLKNKISELETELNEKKSQLNKMDTALAEKDSALAEKDSALAEKDSELTESLTEIARLKTKLAEVTDQ